MRLHAAIALLALPLLAGCAALQRPARSGAAALPVALDAALGNRYVPAGTRADLVVRLRVAAAESGAPRAPINLALVVDTSGSMEGNAIDDARRACLGVLDALSEGDRVALVVFHSRAEVLVPSTEVRADTLRDLRARVTAMRASGTTDMAGGIQLGLAQLEAHRRPGGVDRLVLLGDGVPNRPDLVRALASVPRSREVVLTALGLGPEYDPALMGELARASGGRFVHIEDSAAVAGIFRSEVLRVRHVVARTAAVTIAPGPGVEVREVIGREVRSVAGGAAVVMLADVAADEPREVFVRVSVPPRRDGAGVEVLDATLTYLDADGRGATREQRVFVGAHATSSDATLTQGRDVGVLEAASRAQLATGVLQALRDAQAGAPEAAERALDRAEAQANRDLDAAPSTDADEGLRRQRQSATQLRATLGAMRHRAPTGNAAPAPTTPPTSRADVPAPAPPTAPAPAAFGHMQQEAMDNVF